MQQYLEHWLENIVLDRVRPSTYHSYRNQARLYLIPLLGRIKLAKLTARDIKKALALLKIKCRCCMSGLDLKRKRQADTEREKRQGKKIRKNAKRIDEAKCCAAKPQACCQKLLSDATIRYLHRILRTALQDAVIDGILVQNVAKELRLAHKYSPQFEPWNSVEVMQFLDVNKDHRLVALFGIVLAVGLRKGEALALRWSDVNIDTGVLHIERTLNRVDGKLRVGPVKTEQSNRVVSLPELFLWALNDHRTNQNEERAAAEDKWQDHSLMFTTKKGTAIEPRNLNRLLDILCAKAGVRRIR
ncbi:MAG: site-specific integrase, partial [Mycobacteriales bacterium]